MSVFIRRIAILFLFILLIGITTSCDNSNEITERPNVNNEIFISNDWGSEAIDFEVSDTNNIKIAVIDAENYYISNNVSCFNIVNSNKLNSFGHGSYMVALMCKLLPNSQILSINIADEKGIITEETLCDGIKFAVANDCNIINISLGTQYNYPKLKSTIEYAIEEGCVIVAASGNNNKEILDYPANYERVISVISRNIDNIDVSSNNVSTSKKSVSAPDSVVFNEDIIVDGSSVASVYVTAIVASIKEQLPQSSIDEINDLLQSTSVFSTNYSYGMINYKRIMDTIHKGSEKNGE